MIETIYNFVDVARFRRRSRLPDRPKSVLIFSNYASGTLVENAIRAGCRRFFGIEKVDVAGSGSGNVVAQPEEILGKYDIVFAKGRAAIEAMASGCAVIVADFAGLGGLVTSENLQRLRRLNFGVRTMQAAPVTDDTVFAQLQLYNSQDAAKVTDKIRATADMDSAIGKWESIYKRVVEEWPAFRAAKGATLPREQLAASADYMNSIDIVIKRSFEAQAQIGRLSAEKADLQDRLVRAVRQSTVAKALRAVVAAMLPDRSRKPSL
jgi:hypothetical protein